MKNGYERVLQANWIHPPHVENWLQKMALGRTLNVCSGMSRVGDVRVDIDPDTNRTDDGDLFDLNYRPLSFDTVICDPPFSYYVTGKNRFRWIGSLRKIARKRILLSSNQVNPTNFFHPQRWDTQLFALIRHTPYVRFYWRFDRRDGMLA